jgi:predicted nuclease with RNAse H fold
MRFIGFDPGGDKKFGWSVIEGATRPFAVVQLGRVSDAAAAVDAVVRAVGAGSRIDGVGIDSPLFWTPSGKRRVDRIVREAIKSAGAPNAGGTVQQVNSLRGACLTQGVVAACLLRRAFPGVRITEAHPKALLWLLSTASPARRTLDVRMKDLGEFISCPETDFSEHERDAALGAIAAWAMVSGAVGWRNLAGEDADAIVPFPPVEYWMPIEASPRKGEFGVPRG